MALTLQTVRCLDAVVRAGSFRAAGEALHLSQPSVSNQVQALERALGVQLLRRSTRGTTLTEAGAQMLPHLRAMLRAEESAQQHAAALAGDRGGLVRVAGVNSAVVGLVPDAIRMTESDHPDLDVEVSERTAGEVHDGVSDGTYELGVTADRVQWVPKPGIVAEVLAEGPLMLVAQRDNPVLTAPVIDRALVAAEPLVTLASGYSLRAYALDYLTGHSPRIVSEALNHDTVRRLVAAGLGVTIMPQMTYEAVSDLTDQLAARPLDDSDVLVRLVLLHSGSDAPPAARALAAAIRKVAATRFAG